jgi:hypothetical protein
LLFLSLIEDVTKMMSTSSKVELSRLKISEKSKEESDGEGHVARNIALAKKLVCERCVCTIAM